MCRRAHGAPGTRHIHRAAVAVDRAKLSAYGLTRLLRAISYRGERTQVECSRRCAGCQMLPWVVRCPGVFDPDPITEELFRNAIAALGDEMVLTIYRTAYSGVLKNIMDYSAALCDAQGRLAAQGLALPGHLFDPCRSCRRCCGISVTTSPRVTSSSTTTRSDGGMHLPDVFIFKPLFANGKPNSLCRDDLSPHRCRRARAG